MKKYFAKYLPVEGEIKEGELGLSVDNTIHVYHDSYDEKGKWKKIKLFLCSRDIQIGDKVRSDYDGHPELEGTFDKIKGDYSYFTNPNGEQVMWLTKEEVPSYVFKVIGEISPKAKWLKEGDELLAEGKDCEIFPIHNHDSEGKIVYVNEEGDKVDTPIYIIKCPSCGCFK